MPERGDLLLVPFPFSDLSASKRRPVLALTAPDRYGDFIALPVTSRPQTEHALPIAATDLTQGSLPAASWIRTNRIVTLNVGLVVKTLDGCPRALFLSPLSGSARISEFRSASSWSNALEGGMLRGQITKLRSRHRSLVISRRYGSPGTTSRAMRAMRAVTQAM
jgi:mRNA interferase MazF